MRSAGRSYIDGHASYGVDRIEGYYRRNGTPLIALDAHCAPATESLGWSSNVLGDAKTRWRPSQRQLLAKVRRSRRDRPRVRSQCKFATDTNEQM